MLHRIRNFHCGHAMTMQIANKNDFEFLLFMKAFLFLCNKIMSLLFHAGVKVTSIDNVRQTILNFDYQNISTTIIKIFG